MNRVVVGLCVLLVAGDAVAGSPIDGLSWLGRLETAEGPVDGTVSASFRIVTGEGAVVAEVIEASLPVVEGDFVIDFQISDSVAVTTPLFVAATINGSDLEPNLPLALTWPSSHFAQRSDEVDAAIAAGQIGGITRPLTRSRLETDVDVPLAVVTGFPPAFADGDQGLAFSPGTTIDLNAGVVGIRAGSLPGTGLGATPVVADLADGTIATADLGDGSVTAADLASVPLTKVANGTLTSRHFGTAGLALFEVTEPDCRSDFVGKVVEAGTCTFTGTTACTVVIGGNTTTGHRPCAAQNRPTDCFIGSTSPCPNAPAGVLVFR